MIHYVVVKAAKSSKERNQRKNMSSFPRKRESILICSWSKIKMDSRFRGNDGW